MKSNSELPSPVVQAAQPPSAVRRWRKIAKLFGGLLLLLVLAPLITYLVWQARGRKLLRMQLAHIEGSGDPLTTNELRTEHTVPVGTRDVTGIWVAALKPFDGPAFTAIAGETPLVGTGKTDLPPLHQPLDATDEELMQQFVSAMEPSLAAIRSAANEQGIVRYQRDFRQGPALLLPDAEQLRQAVWSLQTEFELLVRHNDLDLAIRNLATRVAAGETLRDEPIVMSMLHRIEIQRLNFCDIVRLVETRKLDDAQLAELQRMIRPIDIHGQLHRAMVGERAMVWHAFNGPWRMTINPDRTAPHETTRDVRDVSRPEDCALSMKLMTHVVDAAKDPLPAVLEAGDNVRHDLKSVVGRNYLNRRRYAITAVMVPGTDFIANVDGRGEVERDLLDAALAARRYHLKHGTVPKSINDLAPDFLPQIPRDSFDGQPVRMQPSGDGVVLYSVGENRTDDGGLASTEHRMRDVVMAVRLMTIRSADGDEPSETE
jgi:hypothetical protein